MRRFAAFMSVLGCSLVFLLASPAQAAELTGCSGQAKSVAKAGADIDTVTAPGPHGTASDPFLVNWDGTISYSGKSDSVITDHHWGVRVFLIPIKSGGSANDGKKTDTSGVDTVSSDLPFRFVGLYYLSGSLKGTGGSCTGSVWIRLSGNPVGTIPWIAGIVLGLAGLYLLLRAFRKGGRFGHLIKGLFGGLFFGVGLALLMTSYAVVPFGKFTPMLVAAALVVIGILIGLLAPTRAQGAS